MAPASGPRTLTPLTVARRSRHQAWGLDEDTDAWGLNEDSEVAINGLPLCAGRRAGQRSARLAPAGPIGQGLAGSEPGGLGPHTPPLEGTRGRNSRHVPPGTTRWHIPPAWGVGSRGRRSGMAGG